MRFRNPIPGVDQPINTELQGHRPGAAHFAVLKPFNATPAGQPEDLLFSRWLASVPLWFFPLCLAVLLVWPAIGFAASGYTMTDAFQALFRWIPFIVTGGFLFNIIISFFAMLIGTVTGVVLGLMQISPYRLISWPAKIITQIFRNSPWLVLLFIVLLALPFEIVIV